MNAFHSSWFYWGIGVAIGFPFCLILLTEVQHTLVRRKSRVARQVTLIRNYLLPLGALLLLVVNAWQVPAGQGVVRILATVFGFLVLVLMLSGLNTTVFEGAPEGSWRKRLPAIFLDVSRIVLIGVGLAVILSFIWGVRVGGVFTALGVTSVVIGLMLQNSVGQIVSGLFMLFEQPFRIDDWLDAPAAKGRVVEVNWRSVHIDTGSGIRITPNSVLAATSFTNLSRPSAAHDCDIVTKFSLADSPDKVCTLLTRVAGALSRLNPDAAPVTVPLGAGEYRTTVRLTSPADADATRSTFLGWVWYAARRERLHLDGAGDDFSTRARVEEALQKVVAPALRLSHSDMQSLTPHARIVRYGADEILERAGEVSPGMTFLIEGRVRLTATTEDGTVIAIGTLDESDFIGLTALTRQPNLAEAHAVDEVTALQIKRQHLELVVMDKPTLLQDLGRLIDERQSKVRLATRQDRVGQPHLAG